MAIPAETQTPGYEFHGTVGTANGRAPFMALAEPLHRLITALAQVPGQLPDATLAWETLQTAAKSLAPGGEIAAFTADQSDSAPAASGATAGELPNFSEGYTPTGTEWAAETLDGPEFFRGASGATAGELPHENRPTSPPSDNDAGERFHSSTPNVPSERSDFNEPADPLDLGPRAPAPTPNEGYKADPVAEAEFLAAGVPIDADPHPPAESWLRLVAIPTKPGRWEVHLHDPFAVPSSSELRAFYLDHLLLPWLRLCLQAGIALEGHVARVPLATALQLSLEADSPVVVTTDAAVAASYVDPQVFYRLFPHIERFGGKILASR